MLVTQLNISHFVTFSLDLANPDI